MEHVYISDLSHTIQGGLTSEFIPYGVGCIKSYYLHNGLHRGNYEITLFQDPDLLADAFLDIQPSVLAFSNYSWNRNLSYAIAEEAKRRSPETLVVFGGPNYPLDKQEKYKWLTRFPAVDLYILGEGEEPFARVLDYWYEHRDIEQLKAQSIDGLEALSNGGIYRFSDDPYRLKSLDQFPSPYVKGYLDQFLVDEKLIPLTETNRGCPFLCTFCEKGAPAWNAITRTSVSRFGEELTYIARNTKSSLLILADNNFGMFKEDEEIGRLMTDTYYKYSYPLQLITATSKTRYDRVAKTIEAIEGRVPVTLSVQSMDDSVLKNIKRKNLSLENMAEASNNTTGSRSRSEMILGLPGDTRDKHIKGLCDLMDIGISFLLDYTLILLDGSELNTVESRNKWKFETAFRINHRCYGNYQFDNKLLNVAELEEVVIGTDTMSFDDHLRCRDFYFSVGVFYMDQINSELIRTIALFDIKPSEFVSYIHSKRKDYFSHRLQGLYDSFSNYTRQELWTNVADLETTIYETGDKELQNIGGFNVIFSLRAEALSELVEDIYNVSFQCMKDLIGENEWENNSQYFIELKNYVTNKKKNIFNYDAKPVGTYRYDFLSCEETSFSQIPNRLTKPISLKFYHTLEQKKLFGSFPVGKAGAARVLPKLSVGRMYRNVEDVTDRPDYDGAHGSPAEAEKYSLGGNP